MLDEPMHQWWVELEGETVYLEKLAMAFVSSDCTVRASGDGYFLVSTCFDCAKRPEDVRERAKRLLQVLNGLLMLGAAAPRGVELGDVHQRDANGELRHVPCTPALSVVDLRQLHTSGEPLLTPETAARIVRVQATDEDVHDALELWNECPCDWATLYKLIEVIRGSGVKMASLTAGTYVSQKQLARLERTANHEEAAGLTQARHARTGTEPPRSSMSLLEAEDVVARLLVQWLLRKSNNTTAIDD